VWEHDDVVHKARMIRDLVVRRQNKCHP
jgi:hypothetical protein